MPERFRDLIAKRRRDIVGLAVGRPALLGQRYIFHPSVPGRVGPRYQLRGFELIDMAYQGWAGYAGPFGQIRLSQRSFGFGQVDHQHVSRLAKAAGHQSAIEF